MRKIILSVLSLLFVLCLSVSPFAAVAEVESTTDDTVKVVEENSEGAAAEEQEAPDFYVEVGKKGSKFEKVSSSDKAELYMMEVEKYGYVFAVKNLENGAVWYSIKNDVLRKMGNAPIKYKHLFEMISVTYANGGARNRKISTVSSTTLMDPKKYTVETRDNSVVFTFDFYSESQTSSGETRIEMDFAIPLRFEIVDDHLDVSVEFSNIVTGEECKSDILSISVMKYLASSDYSSKNYNLIPDGCGALVYNDYVIDENVAIEYSVNIYNRDRSLSTQTMIGNTTGVVLPVFGTKYYDTACFAIISSGDAVSKVHSKGPIETGYSYIYNEFTYKSSDEMLAATVWDQKKMYTSVSDWATDIEDATVSYYILAGDDADYMGMAEIYHDYVASKRTEDKKMSSDIELYLETIGAVTKQESSFGMIVDVVKPVTTFEQASDMIDDLAKAGLSGINLRYIGWQDGGVGSGIIKDANIENVVGDKDSLVALRDRVAAVSGKLYMDADVVTLDSGAFNFVTKGLVTRNSIDAYCELYNYTLNTGEKIEDTPYYYVSARNLKEQVDDFMADFSEYGIDSVSFGTLGSTHYSDFDNDEEEFCDAVQTGAVMAEILAGLATENSVMVDTGYGHAQYSSDIIVGLPMYDSGYNFGTVDVPFAQIALHGLVTFTETAHNLTTQADVQLLRCLETGAMPYYVVTEEDPSIFADTDYDFIVSSRYDVWKTDIVDNYNTISSVLNGYCDKQITDYKYLTKDNQVRATVYDDELVVVVNYSDKDVKLSNGKTVEANGYITCSAEEV